jgi:hypothetical protein
MTAKANTKYNTSFRTGPVVSSSRSGRCDQPLACVGGSSAGGCCFRDLLLAGAPQLGRTSLGRGWAGSALSGTDPARRESRVAERSACPSWRAHRRGDALIRSTHAHGMRVIEGDR